VQWQRPDLPMRRSSAATNGASGGVTSGFPVLSNACALWYKASPISHRSATQLRLDRSGSLGACGDRLHLDPAAKRQLGSLVDRAGGPLPFRKETGIERVDLLNIG
jgi:hypothetical protein